MTGNTHIPSSIIPLMRRYYKASALVVKGELYRLLTLIDVDNAIIATRLGTQS